MARKADGMAGGVNAGDQDRPGEERHRLGGQVCNGVEIQGRCLIHGRCSGGVEPEGGIRFRGDRVDRSGSNFLGQQVRTKGYGLHSFVRGDQDAQATDLRATGLHGLYAIAPRG